MILLNSARDIWGERIRGSFHEVNAYVAWTHFASFLPSSCINAKALLGPLPWLRRARQQCSPTVPAKRARNRRHHSGNDNNSNFQACAALTLAQRYALRFNVPSALRTMGLTLLGTSLSLMLGQTNVKPNKGNVYTFNKHIQCCNECTSKANALSSAM